MISIVTGIITTMVIFSYTFQSDFLSEQKKYERVRAAISGKHDFIEKSLNKNNIALDNLNLLFVAYKDNDLLEVYAKSKNETKYKIVFSYTICSRSGNLGPKLKQGDYQVPEGFYHIDRFNPYSNFYLSLGINYPNLSDKRRSKFSNLGGDIFIHGACVTIGCLPMTDDIIKEIYLMAVYARRNGQLKIPVYIFPFKMTDRNLEQYLNTNGNNVELKRFWVNLKKGYDIFNSKHEELNVTVATNGDYTY